MDSTLIALVRPGFSVCSHVQSKIACSLERRPAQLTCVPAIAAVKAHVTMQVFDQSKAHTTFWTQVILAAMNFNLVFFPVASLSEGRPTLVTRKGLFPCVKEHVSLKI